LYRYYSLKYFLSLDILNLLRFIYNTIAYFLYSIFGGAIIYLYNFFSLFLKFFGFGYADNIDNFSYNFLLEFRKFVGKFLNNIIYLNYDLNEYNSLFNKAVLGKVGLSKNIKFRHHKLY